MRAVIINISLVTMLTCMFIAFKLAGIINWSWWWVLSPLLIEIGFFILMILMGIGILIFLAIRSRKRRRR